MNILLFFPLCLVISLVLAGLKEDEPGDVLRRGLKAFLLLTAAILGGGGFVVLAGTLF